MHPDRLYVVGAGGLGREVQAMLNKPEYGLFSRHNLYLDAFVDEDENKWGESIHGTEVINIPRMENYFFYLVAMGDIEPRKKMRKIIEQRFSGALPMSIFSSNLDFSYSKIGKGTIIFPNVMLTADVTVGDFSVLYQNVSINHDCKIGDFTTLCPGVTIAANSTVGNSCYIGIGSTIANKVNICDNVILGANTTVVKDIIEPGTYVGLSRKIK